MTFTLRDYQQEAVDAILAHVRSSLSPCIIEAATGAGKSVIIAEVARQIFEMTGKRILVTAPSKELVLQNHAKFLATGNPASIFSASAGQKSLKHAVVFGSPLTIKGRISSFKKNFAMIINDECDLITPSIKDIIDQMREGNPNLRVVGMTATPYQLGKGYIFRTWPDGRINGSDVAADPYYDKCVYSVGARYLIDRGYLTKPVIGGTNAEGYDTSNLHLNKMGKFEQADIDRAYHGHGRITSAIVGDIVAQSQDRKGVLIYAATVRHAEEVMASLPPELSAIVTGETKERHKILERFSKQKLKYIVNVGVLTVGVDLPHVDVIAVLRKSESVRLLQQIVGRGLRLYEDKKDLLYLDYTDNVMTHTPDGDLFAPIIVAKKAKDKDAKPIRAKCEKCGYGNEFSANKDYVDYPIDEYGYCMDVFGSRIETDYGPLSAHHGRRCQGFVQIGKELERCDYYWTSKICECCNCKNDVAARYCRECKAELVDPGAKLLFEFKAMKRDPHLPQCDDVLSMECKPTISRSGRETLRVDFVTAYRQFSVWFFPGSTEHKRFMDVTDNGNVRPKTVGYRKVDDKFYKIHSYNLAADEPERVDKFKRVG